jgi:hypothetical protein
MHRAEPRKWCLSALLHILATFDGELAEARTGKAIKHVQRERVYIVRSERKFSFYSKKWMDTAGQISVLSLHKLPVYYALRFICNE